MSLITSTGCLDNHIKKNHKLEEAYMTGASILDAVSVAQTPTGT